MKNYFDTKLKEAISQIERGLSLRCVGHTICPSTGNVKVGGKVIAKVMQSPAGRHLIIELIDIDPELFVWDDDPEAILHADLFHDLDLIEEIEVLADHVIYHVCRYRSETSLGHGVEPVFGEVAYNEV